MLATGHSLQIKEHLPRNNHTQPSSNDFVYAPRSFIFFLGNVTET
jgi:hypothetical protein